MDLRLWRVGVAERVSLPKRRVSLNYLRLWRVGAAEHVSLRKRGVLPVPFQVPPLEIGRAHV